MNLVPLEDRVVVQVIEQEEKTSSGIVLPIRPRRSHKKAPSWPLAQAGTTRTATS
jgi:co-chaperonin GroES (HSP10)